MNYGENEITIEVDYLQDGITTLETVSCVSDVIITKDVDIAEFEKMEELPLTSTFDDLLVRLNEVKNVNNSIRDNLNRILSSKGIYVDESMRLSKLVNLTIELTNENSQEINDYITQIATLENEIDSLTSELAGKVTPAGDAIASDVLSGKTFINSTGQTITGTLTGCYKIVAGTSYTAASATNNNSSMPETTPVSLKVPWDGTYTVTATFWTNQAGLSMTNRITRNGITIHTFNKKYTDASTMTTTFTATLVAGDNLSVHLDTCYSSKTTLQITYSMQKI